MKNAIQNSQTPLLGTFDKLNDLFAHTYRLHATATDVPGGGHPWVDWAYPIIPGAYPLSGLPGSVGPACALFVEPHAFVARALQAKCHNYIIGGFRIIRSAELMKLGLLPVYAFDYHRFVSILVAYVSYSEHERFNT